MRHSFVFSVRGTPRPQPRPRFVRGRVVSTADPKARLWRIAVERAVTAAISASRRERPLFTGPVRLTCVFTFEPPPVHSDRLGKPHTHKPDADNLLKLVEDVMEAAGVFANDSQVCAPTPQKWWGRVAGVAVMVEDASEERRVEPSAEAPGWLAGSAGGD